MLRTKFFINLGFNDVQNGQIERYDMSLNNEYLVKQSRMLSLESKNSQNEHMHFMNYICVDIVYNFISQKLTLTLMFINV